MGSKSGKLKLGAIVDTYNLKARQFPVTVALAPAIVAALAAVPELHNQWGFLGGMVAGLGLPYAFAQAAGEAGYGLESGLYNSWGGMPSVSMLRHGDARIDTITKQSYFEVLRSVGIPMPTADDESRDSNAADKAYEAASAWLRKETRDDKKYPRVKTELTNYGLARNLLGIRKPALIIAFGTIAAQTALIAIPMLQGQKVEPFVVLSLVFGLVMAFFWQHSVSVRWVRRAAEAYARALLEACDQRKPPPAPKKNRAANATTGKHKVKPAQTTEASESPP